jgi:zinc transport system substrate-binding protein
MKIIFIYSRDMTRRVVAAIGVVAALAPAGCARGSAQAGGRLDVLASFYPLAFVASQVGGDRVVVGNLTPQGAEPHDLELTPGAVARLHRADLVVYLSGHFQPAVEAAVPMARRSLDVRAAAATGADAHFWLDPSRMVDVTGAVAAKLAAIDPSHASGYRQRADALVSALRNLDGAYRSAFASCRRHEIVTSHAAFGYLAKRYGLTQIPIAGLDPETEPTPGRIADVVGLARKYRVKTIFYESLVSPKIAQTIAHEAHVGTDVLDPIEGVRNSDDYLTVMRRNLGSLRRALDCT